MPAVQRADRQGPQDVALPARAPAALQEVVDLAPPLQAYLQHVAAERRLATRTVALYTEGLQQLQALALAESIDVLAVQPQQVRRSVARWHSQRRHGRSIALWLSCWRGFYRWAAWQGWVERNPVEGIRPPKTAQPLPKALGVDQAVQLSAFSDHGADPWDRARDDALTELLYSSGLRVSELVGLDVAPPAGRAEAGSGWVDLNAAMVHVLGKGGKRRSVPVGVPAMGALQRWLAVRADRFGPQWQQAALFVGARGARLTPHVVRQRLRQRALDAGVPGRVHPHVLRHSFASHVLQSSGDLRAVQELLGHANIRTTQIYTRLDFQHLAQAYEQAHPRARKSTAGKK